MEADKNPFPKIHILPRIGHALIELSRLHLLSPVSDHFTHPLDDVFDGEPYSDTPVQESLFNMNQMYFPED